MVTISIIIAIYNDEPFLQRCMDCVLKQTYRDFELICVNDGSTDKTLEMLKNYQNEDSRIIIASTSNYNAGHARNLGLSISRGKYLLFLDADDFFEKDMLKCSINAIQESESDICVFRSNTYDYSGNKFIDTPWTIDRTLLPRNVFSPKDVSRNIFKLFVGWAWDKLLSRDLIIDNDLEFQEQRTTNDMYFVFMAIVLSKKICVIDNVLVHHQRGYTSLSNTREKSWTCFINALRAIRKSLEENKLYDEYRCDFINYALHAILWNLNSLKQPQQPYIRFLHMQQYHHHSPCSVLLLLPSGY